jgi:acyl-CoA thioester hydrolase
MAFSQPIDVRFSDLDAMGHVNNAVFVSYLEHARFKWWAVMLAGRDFLEEGFLIARVEMDYRKPIVLRDEVRVDVRVTQIGNSSFALGYKVIRTPDEVVLAEAHTVQVTMDFQTQRPRPIRPETLAWLKTQL